MIGPGIRFQILIIMFLCTMVLCNYSRLFIQLQLTEHLFYFIIPGIILQGLHVIDSVTFGNPLWKQGHQLTICRLSFFKIVKFKIAFGEMTQVLFRRQFSVDQVFVILRSIKVGELIIQTISRPLFQRLGG